MCTCYRNEIRDKVRVYLHGLGRVEDARSIDGNTSMEKLREKTSFSSIEDMYSHFNHTPCVSNPDGAPTPITPPIPCYLLFGETNVKVTRFASMGALIGYIGLDYTTSRESIRGLLCRGGGRLHIGKYVFAITRRYTTAIESIPLSKNNCLNARIAAKILGGVPNTRVSMYDIARSVGVKTGGFVTRRLCKHFGIEYHKTNGTGNPNSIPRHTALTNLRTREVFEFGTITEAAKYLRVFYVTLREHYTKQETIPFYGDRYAIDIDYSSNEED